MNLEARLRADVEAVHAFIAGWFRGNLPDSPRSFEDQLASRFAPGFVNIQPAGRRLSRSELVDSIRSGYGTNTRFEISISEFRVVAEMQGATRVLATYTETQFGARASTPPENVRVSTVLFDCEAMLPEAPGRPIWLHLHETACALAKI